MRISSSSRRVGLRVGLAALVLAGVTAGLTASALGAPPNTKFKKKVTIKPAPVAQTAVPKAAQSAAPAAASSAPAATSGMFEVLADSYPSMEGANQFTALGVKKYMVVYPYFDPDAGTTGLVDADKLIAHVKSQFGNNPQGWGMLDYEGAFFVNILKGPGNSDYEKTVSSMVAAIKKVKAAFPNVKWTYYGMPYADYWIKNWWDWQNAPDVERAGEIDRQAKNFGPIIKEVDWVAPCFYDNSVYSKRTPDQRPAEIIREKQSRIARITVTREIFKRLNIPAKPIIPVVCLHYSPGGNGVEHEMIPVDELLMDQITPTLAGGADGIALWGAHDSYLGLATSPNGNGWAEGAQVALRAAWTKSLLNGQVPSNWTAAPVKKQLSDKLQAHVLSAATKIREAAVTNGRTVGGPPPQATAGVTKQ